MKSEQLIKGNPEIFKLMPRDIDHIYKRANLSGNTLSPFRYSSTEAEYPQPSEWAQALFEAPVFARAARLLLEPDLKIMYHSGGGGTAEDAFPVLMRQDDSAVLMAAKNKDDDFLCLMFPSISQFLDWWCSMYSNLIKDEYPSPFNNAMPLETLLSALHSIDIYRRSYMESMLNYKLEQGMSVRRPDFLGTLTKALASGDIRWLLPSIFRLTPGLTSVQLKLLPEHLEEVEKMGIIKSWTDENQENMYTLSENGKILGSEFSYTWMSSIGWKASILKAGQEMILSRVYLAPTAFTNHLFSFQATPAGSFTCNHQSLTGVKLRENLDQWFKTIYDYAAKNLQQRPAQAAVPPPPPVKAAQPAPPPIPQAQVAPPPAPKTQPTPPPIPEPRQQEIPEQKPRSEMPVPPPVGQKRKVPKCPACQMEIEPGQRFCGSCGTPLPKSNW